MNIATHVRESYGERERERKKQRVGDVVATQRGVYSHERTRALQDASHTTPTTQSPSLEHVPAPVPPQLFILYDVDVLLGLFQSSCLDSSSRVFLASTKFTHSITSLDQWAFITVLVCYFIAHLLAGWSAAAVAFIFSYYYYNTGRN